MTTVISSKDASRKSGAATRKRATRPAPPTEDEIRILAYDLYRRREADGRNGDPVSDWMEAERRLTGQAEA